VATDTAYSEQGATYRVHFPHRERFFATVAGNLNRSAKKRGCRHAAADSCWETAGGL